MMIKSELDKVEQRISQIQEQRERLGSPVPTFKPRYTETNFEFHSTDVHTAQVPAAQPASLESPFMFTPFIHEPAFQSTSIEDATGHFLQGKHWDSVYNILFSSSESHRVVSTPATPIKTQASEEVHQASHEQISISPDYLPSTSMEEEQQQKLHEFHRRNRQFPQSGGRRILVPVVPSYNYCRLLSWLSATLVKGNDIVDLLTLQPVISQSTNQPTTMDAVIIPNDPHELYSPGMEPRLYATVSSAFANLKNVEVLLTSKGTLLQEELARTDEYRSDLVILPMGATELNAQELANSCPIPALIFK